MYIHHAAILQIGSMPKKSALSILPPSRILNVLTDTSIHNCLHSSVFYNSSKSCTLDEEKNGYVARDQLLYAL